jgi:hypothetical protein
MPEMQAPPILLKNSLARSHWAGALANVFLIDHLRGTAVPAWSADSVLLCCRTVRRVSPTVLGMVRAPLCPSTLATVCRSAERSAIEEDREAPVPRDPAVTRYLLDKTGCICLLGGLRAVKSLKSSEVIRAFLALGHHHGGPDCSCRSRQHTHFGPLVRSSRLHHRLQHGSPARSSIPLRGYEPPQQQALLRSIPCKGTNLQHHGAPLDGPHVALGKCAWLSSWSPSAPRWTSPRDSMRLGLTVFLAS